MPWKSASEVGVTMPQPSAKRIGRKPATKLECCVPSDVEQHLVAGRVGPEERHDRVEHRQLEVLAAAPPLPGEQRGGDGLAGVQRGHLVGRGLAQEHAARRRRGRPGSRRTRRRPGSRCRRRCGRGRARRAEAGERHVDDVGVDGRARRRSRARARSITPGRKFCDDARRPGRRAAGRCRAPSGCWMSTAIERLPRLHTRYSALMPLTATPTQRAMSPMPGRSTLITSAPWSASSAAAYGPVSAIDRSRTLMPAIGPGCRWRSLPRTPAWVRGRPPGPL